MNVIGHIASLKQLCFHNTCSWLERQGPLNNSGIQSLKTLFCTQFLGRHKSEDNPGKRGTAIWLRRDVSSQNTEGLDPPQGRIKQSSWERTKVYLSAFQFLLSLSSPWDFLICLKYCKFPEYQAHPYSNVSTKTHCKAKYEWFLGY